MPTLHPSSAGLDSVPSITPKQAKKLAINYCAYCEANRANDNNGIGVWGRMLLESQKETGVELMHSPTLEGHIKSVAGATA